MESMELYRQLLGLSAPWTVERVELDVAKGRVEVYAGHELGRRFACPARRRLLWGIPRFPPSRLVRRLPAMCVVSSRICD